jgi:hypothetical protein
VKIIKLDVVGQQDVGSNTTCERYAETEYVDNNIWLVLQQVAKGDKGVILKHSCGNLETALVSSNFAPKLKYLIIRIILKNQGILLFVNEKPIAKTNTKTMWLFML